MLRLLFVVGAWLVAWAFGVSEIIALHQVNTSVLLYPNGTLDYAKVKSQIRHIQHRHCLAQQKHHSCRWMFPSLYKRHHSQEAMEQSGLAGAPTIQVYIGDQALMLMFDTVRRPCTVPMLLSGAFLNLLVRLLMWLSSDSNAHPYRASKIRFGT